MGRLMDTIEAIRNAKEVRHKKHDVVGFEYGDTFWRTPTEVRDTLITALDEANEQLRIGHDIVVEVLAYAGHMSGVDWRRLNEWLVEREREKRENE